MNSTPSIAENARRKLAELPFENYAVAKRLIKGIAANPERMTTGVSEGHRFFAVLERNNAGLFNFQIYFTVSESGDLCITHIDVSEFPTMH